MFENVHLNPAFRTSLASRVMAAARPRWYLRPFVLAPAALAFSLLVFVAVENSSLAKHVTTSVDNAEISWDISHGGNSLEDPATLAEEQQLLSMVQN